jgi:hypothetical protein
LVSLLSLDKFPRKHPERQNNHLLGLKASLTICIVSLFNFSSSVNCEWILVARSATESRVLFRCLSLSSGGDGAVMSMRLTPSSPSSSGDGGWDGDADGGGGVGDTVVVCCVPGSVLVSVSFPSVLAPKVVIHSLVRRLFWTTVTESLTASVISAPFMDELTRSRSFRTVSFKFGLNVRPTIRAYKFL